MARMKWKIDFKRWSFEDPNYYVSLFLTCTVGIFILYRVWVFRLDEEHRSIQKEIVRMSAEEVAFDQRTANEGNPPFFSWERKSKP